MKKKKKFPLSLKVLMVVVLLAPNLFGFSYLGYNSSNNTVNVAQAAAKSPERITLASYTLTKAQTKDFAKSMKNVHGNNNVKILILGLAAKWGGLYGWASVLAAQLSSNSVFKQEVVDAAAQGKRIKITITDYKDYHTSYSTQVKYTIVK